MSNLLSWIDRAIERLTRPAYLRWLGGSLGGNATNSFAQTIAFLSSNHHKKSAFGTNQTITPTMYSNIARIPSHTPLPSLRATKACYARAKLIAAPVCAPAPLPARPRPPPGSSPCGAPRSTAPNLGHPQTRPLFARQWTVGMHACVVAWRKRVMNTSRLK